MPTNITRESLSSEVIQVVVRSSVTLDTQPVAIALVDAGTEPVGGDFDTAFWQGSASTTRMAQLGAAAYSPGSYDIYVRVTDVEVPVLYAGRMLVT